MTRALMFVAWTVVWFVMGAILMLDGLTSYPAKDCDLKGSFRSGEIVYSCKRQAFRSEE